MPLYLIGLSHHTAPVEVRERFAFTETEIRAAYGRMRAAGVAEEMVILSTCNRVELYVVSVKEPAAVFDELQGFLRAERNIPPDLSLPIYRVGEPQSVEHLFRVASGLDSMVLGETEILGQLKRAYELARQAGQTGALMNRSFQRAFHVAKQIRSETNIQRGSVSVGSVAVELAEKIFSSLAERKVMVLGAGDTSEKTARALLSRGVKTVLVSNRSWDRAAALAAELGGRAIRFEEWQEEFQRIDIVITSTAAPHYILDRRRLEPMLKLRKEEPILLIDIAVPRDIDPEVNFLEHVFLYNIDDLQSIATDYLKQREGEIARCETIIKARAQALLGARGARPMPGSSRPAFSAE